jgi:putative transposase
MRKIKFSEHQIIAILKAVEAGRTVRDVCREHEISDATYYQWKSKYGGMQASDIKRLREIGRREPTLEADVSRPVTGESGAEKCDRKKALKEYFEGKTLREISAQSVEKFKNDRMNTPTKKGTARQPATVNRELTLLSSAYSLAVKYDKAESNPCSKVDLFTLDNLRYRYRKRNLGSWHTSVGHALTYTLL